MANQIQIKRSTVAGKVPDAANIAVGELAVNLTDQKLYTKDESGNVFLLGAGNTNNLIEGNSNLFYTNARARTAISVTGAATYNNTTGVINVTGGVTSVNGANGAVVLTTANIAESGNLYYTNARVYSNVTFLLPTYTGNVGASNVVGTLANTTIFSGNYSFIFNNVGNVIIPNAVRSTIVSANVWEGLYTSNVIENTNLYYTNARVYSNIAPLLTTANITELTNLYYTNSRVRTAISVIGAGTYDNITGVINIVGGVTTVNGANGNVVLTTSNIAEGSNLYFTNNRVYSNVIGLLNLKANVVDLTTSNVAELNNLYYTNTRVYSNVVGPLSLKANVVDLTTSNVAELNNLYYTNTRVYSNVVGPLSLKANVVDLTTANVAELNNLYYTNARVYSNVVGPLRLKANVVDLTTANVVELNNLYYTNARVYSNVIGPLNLKANVVDLTTANVVELNNLYYTNARVYSNVIGPLNLKANVVDLTTSNVAELNNLYYTNARVYSNVIGPLNLKANVVDLTTSNVAELNNLYYTNARVYSNVIGPLNLKANVVDLTTSNVTELNNLYYTNTRVYSNVIGLLNLKANVVDLTTSNVAELNNLYYTNTRVYSNVIGLLNLKANVVDLTTSNVAELNNLYYTNTRVYSNVIGPLNLKANVVDLTTSNVAELNNLYYTNTRVYSNVIGPLNLKANVVDLTTSNVAELNNLYYTNARVYSNVISLLPTYTGNIGASNVVGLNANTAIIAGNYSFTFDNTGNLSVPVAVRTNILYANIIQGASTSNITEGTNLYYTNARVRSALTSGNNIAYDTTTGNITLIPSGVTATTYGGTSNIPVVTVDQFGRITSASNVAVAGVNGFTSSGNSFTITTAAGSSFTANLQPNSVRLGTDTTGDYVSNIIAGTSIVVTNQGGEGAAPTVSTVQDIGTASSPTFYNLTVSGNLTVIGNVTTITSNTFEVNDPLIYLAGNNYFSDVVDIGFVGNYYDGVLQRHAGLFRDASDAGRFKLFSNLNPEPTDVIDTANSTFRYADLFVNTLIGNVTGTVSSLNNHDTSDLAEGTNLYYTNSRARSTISAGDTTIIYDSALGTIKANVSALGANVLSVNGFTGVVTLSTTNIPEGSNLYYTNARVYSNIAPLLTTANITELVNLYYTNTRVYSNVISLLPTYTGNISVGNVIGANAGNLNLIAGTSTAVLDTTGNITLTGGVFANAIYSNQSCTTIVSGSYETTFTNTGNINVPVAVRTNILFANIIQGATTSNITEGTNLYYTNARVYSNISPLLTTANIAELTNLYYSNARVYSNIAPLLTTANIAELNNLYYTNARVYSNVIGLLDLKANVVDLTTANVAELNNLYYSNARVYSNIAPLLTTANIAEITNLYYSNSRVYSNVVSLLPTYNGNISAGNLNAVTNDNLSIVAGNARTTFDTAGNVNVPVAVRTNILYANIIQGATTSNITEGTNLYYTNARVRSTLSAGDGTILYDSTNGTIRANVTALGANVLSVNGFTGIVTLSTTNIPEGSNLYYTNARVYSNIAPLLTTANITELTNLYYSNARVYSNVISLLPTYTGNIGGNIVGTTQNTIILAGSYSFTFDNTGNVNVPVAVRTNILYANVIQGATTSNITEGTNLYYSNARVYSNIAPLLTTANIAEITNLYYSNARVYSNVISLLPTYTGNIGASNVVGLNANTSIIAGNFTFTFDNTGNLSVGTAVRTNILYANIIQGATTSNITEGTNLYYSNSRVYSNIAPLLTTANITELTNLYYSNSRVYSNIAPLLTTANITELTNLYYTNSRVYSNVISLLPNYTGNVGGNLIGTGSNTSIIAGNYSFTFDNNGNLSVGTAVRTNILYANIIQGATTSNITEGTNLYYTNARARTAISVTGSGSYNNTTGIINIAGTTIYSGPGITYESGNGNVSFTEYLFPTGDYGDLTTSFYDAFGALIYTKMDMMNPPGSIVTKDLGVL